MNALAHPERGAEPLTKERLVVIGNGMAGCRAVEEILANAPDRFAITIFGAEPRVNYNRIMLSAVLAGEATFDEIIINGADWYQKNQIELVSGDPIVRIDRDTKQVVARSGKTASYDRLLIATGSEPFVIPVPGKDANGVITFRDLNDVNAMLAASNSGGTAVVIGGGLLGLEAAHGLSLRGMNVTVLHLMPTLMERQLDEAAATLLKKQLEGRGITILTGADTQEILEADGQISGVRLKDGTEIPADIVVMAVGIRPNSGLAVHAGLKVERGIVVDDFMQTSDPAILAVGECVQHRGQCYGLVAPLWEMCSALGSGMGGKGSGYQGSVTSTKLKVSGINVFSAGDFSGGEGCDDIVMHDHINANYKRVIVKDDKVIGAVLFGDTADGSWYFDLMQSGEDVGAFRELLIFGRAFAESEGREPEAALEAVG